MDGKTLLLVEDEAIIAMSQKRRLENYGAVVFTAGGGEKALELFKLHPEISLVLMDIDLGSSIDGIEAARRLLAIREVPVVFMSSHYEPEIVNKTDSVSSYGYVVKGSNEIALVTSLRMACRLFEARREQQNSLDQIQHSQKLLDYIISHTRSAIAVHDTELCYVYVSKRYLEVFRVTETQVIGRHHYDVFPDIPEKWREVHRRALAGEVLHADDDPFERADGSIDWTCWECRPWYQADGRIGGIIVYTEVINDRKETELRLRRSEESLRITMDSIGDAVIAVDTEARVTLMNPIAEQLCGWQLSEAVGRPLQEVFCIISSETRQPCENPVGKVLKSGRIVGLANHTALLSANGNEYQIADSAAPIRADDGSIHGVVLVFRDITDQYAAEAERKQLLSHKELLLKESHHRIKNNIGVVHNLLLLQANQHAAGPVRDILLSAAGRLQSMMALYDKLYRNEDYTLLAMPEYLQHLVEQILQQFRDLLTIDATVHSDQITLDSGTAASVGIIINELITNSVKHGFTDCSFGSIDISLQRSGGQAVLQYNDSGCGLGDIQPEKAGFGLQLIEMQAEQCGGSLQICNDTSAAAGVQFTISFPINPQLDSGTS